MKVVDFTVPFNPKPNKIKTIFKSLEDFNEVSWGSEVTKTLSDLLPIFIG